ncbi:rod shape-determining protein RodA [Clostridia bacterium]|nr:rod shape-determining protein RodA [Clostridia bacterium]
MKEVGKGLKRFFRGADMPLLFICLLAAAYGVLLIASATRTYPNGSHGYISRQLIAVAIGVALYIVLTIVDVRIFGRLWKILAVFNVGFIALLVPFGQGGNGNKSWLRFKFLPFDIQPAEFVKVTFILLMAWHMYCMKDKINRPLPMLGVVAHFLAQFGLILVASRDLGVALIYVFAFFCMLIGAGVKPRWFIAAFAAAGGALPLLWFQFMNDTLKKRVIYFFSPESDPLGAGYHVLQSMKAFTNGGLFGQGLFKGSQTQGHRIFGQNTDFVFTVAGEELGFFLTLLIPLLLLIIIGRCFYIATKAQNGFGSLICIGIAGTVIFQTFENIGMCIGVTPIIGITLPFFSYGGSSILSTFAAMGLVSSIKMHPFPSWIRDRGR